MIKSFLKLSVLFLVISLCSCENNNDENIPSFNVNLNDVAFEPNAIACGLSHINSANSQRLNLHARDDDTNIISIAMESGTIEDCMPVGDYPIEDILITLSYVTNNGGSVIEHTHLDVDLNSTLSASIISCSDEKISGKFSGTFRKIDILQDEFETPETVEITNGEFNNIPFQIINN